MSDVIGGDMTTDMVHRDKGHTQCIGGRLGKVDADQYCANQAGGTGRSHGINIFAREVSLVNGALGQQTNGLEMFSGCDLRHNAAIDRMHFDLGNDRIRQHFPAVTNDSHRRLITGGLYGQNDHTSTFLKYRVIRRASSFGSS